MDAAALAGKICNHDHQEHFNSIIQHHFTEVFLGNCTDGGIFLSTKSRRKLDKTELARVFTPCLLPGLAFLQTNYQKDGRKDKDNDKEETDDVFENSRVRFFHFEKKKEPETSKWVEVCFISGNEIKKLDGDGETLAQAVRAYSKSVDCYFGTSLHETIFNEDETDLAAEDMQEEPSTGEPSPKKLKVRHRKTGETKNSFGPYIIKPKGTQDIVHLLPLEAMDVFAVGMSLSASKQPLSAPGEYETNLQLKVVKKVPKEATSDLLYDPWGKYGNEGDICDGFLCLKIGMMIRKGRDDTITSTATIIDFSRGKIVTLGGFMGDITQKVLDENIGGGVQVLVGKKTVPQADQTGSKNRRTKSKKTEDWWVPLTTMDMIAVKRNPRESVNLRNRERTGGRGARIIRTRRAALQQMQEDKVFGGMVEDASKQKEIHLEDSKGLQGEDRAYRPINDLPKESHPYTPATAIDKIPVKFECNICEKELSPIGMLDGDNKEPSATNRMVLRRRMLNCIAEDIIWEKKNMMERIAKIPNDEQGKEARGKEERGRGKIKASVTASLLEHCKTSHVGNIGHHFAPPKMKSSFWAWELTVGYVAQVLLESSLLQLGLDKGLFEDFKHSWDSNALCCQIGCICGGASMITTKNLFNGKLVGYKYHGLYLPGRVDPDTLASPEDMAEMRWDALAKVEAKAKEWIMKTLLPEMQCFDHLTLLAAITNSNVENDQVAAYLWNAFGLFFRRGVYGDNDIFPPARKALGCEQLKYSMWDALEDAFEKKGMVRNRSVVGLDGVTESVAL